MTRGFVTAIAIWLFAGHLHARTIYNACVASERGTGQQRLCFCIHQVADQTLTDRDKRLVKEFFVDPERAQDIRRSNRRVHEKFWERYERFGTAAETLCKR
ncbi:MAG: hypothetical protein AAGF55_13395 [Pseudomonadota bacterium]